MYLIAVLLLELLGASAFVYIVNCFSGFELLWLLPMSFMLCIPVLLLTVLHSKYSVFYFLFTITVVLRFVIHPLLIAITGEYSELAVRTILDPEDMNNAAILMTYELLVCTAVVYRIYSTNKLREQRRLSYKVNTQMQTTYVLPKNVGIYKLAIVITLLLVLAFPNSLKFFSFGVLTLGRVRTDAMSTFEQIAVMFVIATKYFLLILLLMECKKKADARPGLAAGYKAIALVFALIFGCFYYGMNRLVFVFTFISAIFIYKIIFGSISKAVLLVIGIVGLYVLFALTEARNYFDYYSALSGVDYYLRLFKSMINAYLGGITNVGVAINTKVVFGDNATLQSLLYDLLRPIVGLNKILPVNNQVLSNAFYNYVFFGDSVVVSQIMPMIGYGYYYFGGFFAPIADIAVLMLFGLLEKYRSETLRVDLVYIFLSITMRLSMLFGINIIIVNNEVSMQLLFPLLIYWLNNRIILNYSKD